MKEELKRDYNFTDARLVHLTNEKIEFAERDANQLNQYGFSGSNRIALQTFCDNFENQPDDTEMESDKMIATEDKQAVRKKLEIYTRQLMQRVISTFGEKSARYRKFGTKGLSQKSDDELHKMGNRVVRCATEYLFQLSARGVTQAMINSYQNLVELFEERLKTVEKKIGERDVATENRIQMGNSLYQRLRAMCDIGKTIWQDASEAHYNDYVIHNTSSGTDGVADDDGTPPIVE